jgi:hypothetical protein
MNRDALRDTWLMFQREHACSIDRMLCDPALRSEFLSAAAAATGCHNEQDLLWTLVALRKKKTLPSTLR